MDGARIGVGVGEAVVMVAREARSARRGVEGCICGVEIYPGGGDSAAMSNINGNADVVCAWGGLVGSLNVGKTWVV